MSERRSLILWIVVILIPFGAFGLLEVLGVTNQVSYNPPLDLPEFAQVVGALGSAFLTAGLLYLYSRQTAILREEKKQTEYESEALIRVEDVRIVGVEEVKEHLDEKDYNALPHLLNSEVVEITISNFGRAPADELRIEAILDGDGYGWTGQSPLVMGDWESAMDRLNGPSVDVIRLNDTGGAIGTDEREVKFAASLNAISNELEEQWDTEFPINGQGPEVPKYLSATDVLWAIQDMTESEVMAGIRLWYRDGTGVREPLNLQFAIAESARVSDFRTAVYGGRPAMPAEIPDATKWW